MKRHKTIRGKRINKTDLAYIAGLFDGEGSIFIARIKNKRSGAIWYRLNVSFSMTDREPVEMLHNIFSLRRKTLMYIKGRERGYKDVAMWLSTGNVALRFLQCMEPWLRVKKPQARLGIEFQEWRNASGNPGKPRTKEVLEKCEEYRQRMKKLNGVCSRND